MDYLSPLPPIQVPPHILAFSRVARARRALAFILEECVNSAVDLAKDGRQLDVTEDPTRVRVKLSMRRANVTFYVAPGVRGIHDVIQVDHDGLIDVVAVEDATKVEVVPESEEKARPFAQRLVKSAVIALLSTRT